jgi:hypothetical protein
MEHADGLTAALLALFGGLILFFLWRARRGHVPYVRPIAGITAMEEAVGRATELGRPVIFAMGESDVRDIITHASLSVLEYVARLAARLRTPFRVLVQKPDVYAFAESAVHNAYQAEGAGEVFNAQEQVQYLSDNTIVFAMSTARMIEDTQAGCALFVGTFSFSSLLMTEPGSRAGVLQIAADPNLAQVPFYVCTCDYTIIGEEYFAAGSYVSADPALRGGLVSQDLIKVVFGVLIVVGLGAKLLYDFKWFHWAWMGKVVSALTHYSD